MKRLRQGFWKATRSSLRYKLLALALSPVLLAMPVTLAVVLYWLSTFTFDSLVVKANSDLALGRYALEQVEQEYLGRLERLAKSYNFQVLVTAGDTEGLQRERSRLVQSQGFVFVHLTDELGTWLHEGDHGVLRSSKPSPLTQRAFRGTPGAAIEVFDRDYLLREGKGVAERIAPPGRPDRFLMLRVVYPLRNDQGQVLAILDGAVLIERNFAFVNAIRQRVFGAEDVSSHQTGVVTLLLDAERVSTTLHTAASEVFLGTRVSSSLRDVVLGEGHSWVGRDFVLGQSYISAYQPIYDVHGQRVGMLHTGFPDAPFLRAHYKAAGVLLVVFLGVMVLAAWLAARGARSIFHPVEKMIQVVRATQVGDDRRIGKVDSNDEIGELARQFDAMLNRLQERSRQIQRAADELEGQVESRTQELKEKNENLETTIRLLREARERLVAAEKMAAVGEFAAGIAHEINNPAAVILGNLDVLVAELGEAVEPVQVEVDLIAQQVDRIRTIVDSLLQYARSTGPTAPLSEVDVNRIVENTLPLVRHNIKMASIKVSQRLNATRLIHINRYQLQQVLINLIVNAVNAVLEGGNMELTTEDWAERGVVISIKDDGKGIAPSKLSRVFDPFFTTDSQHGTGLGLSVSYSLVRRYGGDITVESAIGKGCVFRVWLLSEPRLSGTEGVPSQSEVRNAV